MEIHQIRMAIPARAMAMGPALPWGAREMETGMLQGKGTRGIRLGMGGINDGGRLF